MDVLSAWSGIRPLAMDPKVGADGWDPASFTVLAQQYMRMKRTHNGKVVPGVMDSAAAKHLSHVYNG